METIITNVPTAVSNSSLSNHDFKVAMLVGAFSLIASLIGALSGLCVVWIQSKFTREFDSDRRNFDARKEAYQRSIAVFTYALGERIIGNKHPNSKEEKQELIDSMSMTILFSDKELIKEIEKFASYIITPIPSHEEEKKKDDTYGTDILQKIINEMRKEIGHGEYLEDTSHAKK